MIKCPACHGNNVEPLYSGGMQPLMALNLPHTLEQAQRAPTYPMSFYVCCYCGHVYNSDFDYAKIPYAEDSNRMFNLGFAWATHLEEVAALLRGASDCTLKTVVDIGAGDGGFLNIFRRDSSGSRCVAYEPGIDAEVCRELGLETEQDYFIPQRDMPKLMPDALTCRHVLEHIADPRDFVAEISYFANKSHNYPLFLVEVPCISKALETCRVSDFLYEHVNNFTQRSLRVMFESVGWETCHESLAYNDEVALWIGRPKYEESSFMGVARTFRQNVQKTAMNVQGEIDRYCREKATIAYWGGTGKGAAFLNCFFLCGHRVVDSDAAKVGRCVPGMGQKIEHADALLDKPVDVIIITTRWRAADIYAEIRRKHIEYSDLLILDGTELRSYTEADYVAEK